MGVDGWRSKCDYDGKKERGVRSDWVLGERGGSASRVDLFQRRKPSPLFFSEKEGGEGDG